MQAEKELFSKNAENRSCPLRPAHAPRRASRPRCGTAPRPPRTLSNAHDSSNDLCLYTAPRKPRGPLARHQHTQTTDCLVQCSGQFRRLGLQFRAGFSRLGTCHRLQSVDMRQGAGKSRLQPGFSLDAFRRSRCGPRLGTESVPGAYGEPHAVPVCPFGPTWIPEETLLSTAEASD